MRTRLGFLPHERVSDDELLDAFDAARESRVPAPSQRVTMTPAEHRQLLLDAREGRQYIDQGVGAAERYANR